MLWQGHSLLGTSTPNNAKPKVVTTEITKSSTDDGSDRRWKNYCLYSSISTLQVRIQKRVEILQYASAVW